MPTVSLSELLNSTNQLGYTGSRGSFDGTTDRAVLISNATPSTDTVSGALQVAGGAGIGGNVHVGQELYVTGNILPVSNNTVNIGSPTQRFGTVYLSANSVDIGGAVISTTEQGSVLVETTTGNIDLNANAVSFLSNVAQGTAGQTGYTGSRGTDGVIGVDGYTGSAGANGAIGYTGSKGTVAITIGNTTPVGSTSGDLWYRESNDTMYRYMVFGTGSYWIDITGPVHNFGVSASDFITINDSAAPIGQIAYTTPGTYSWTAPAYVTRVSVVAIGGGGAGRGGGLVNWGGGGGGGGLGWKNNIAVTPGQTYTVVVGASPAGVAGVQGTHGGDSYFIDSLTVAGLGGKSAAGSYGAFGAGGSYVGDGGGVGGAGGSTGGNPATGGGGAGGYTGNGGAGGGGNQNGFAAPAGGGGGGGGGAQNSSGGNMQGGGGGGVGIVGEGSSGAGGYGGPAGGNFNGLGGAGGSNGTNGTDAVNRFGGAGGTYGGGGGGGLGGSGTGQTVTAGSGMGGAVRIIWGFGRSFPGTLTTDQ